MSTKAVFVLMAFVLLILAVVGGLTASTDLTPDTLPASTTGGQVQVQQVVVVGGVSTSLCVSPYIVQTGDTLSSIASRCGLSINDLVSANPSITNPNFICAGQRLVLPASRSVQVMATAAPTAEPIQGVPPGTRLTVDILNVTPNSTVKLGIGPTGGLYNVIGESLAGEDGNLTTEIVIPESAVPGESWTVTAITSIEPSQEFSSKPITIGSRP